MKQSKPLKQTEQLKNFAETNHCTAGVHCRTCRDREGGRYWRLMLAQCYALPNDEVDFECPHGKPWGFIAKDVETESDSAKRAKRKRESDEETPGLETEENPGGKNGDETNVQPARERRYALSPEVREKLRDVFLQFRTACYQHRSLKNCDCELHAMGNCGLKTTLKNTGRLPCAESHFPAVEIDAPFRQQLNDCEQE
ncbi:MAG: hypothetical protein JXA11_04350 [Phycisphaerae bacterium]|nr:hypothetical protein [Phycisphaerae bacterium]